MRMWHRSIIDAKITFSGLCVSMPPRNRTYASGSKKRKIKKAVDKLVQSQWEDMHKFLKSNNGASTASINQDD